MRRSVEIYEAIRAAMGQPSRAFLEATTGSAAEAEEAEYQAAMDRMVQDSLERAGVGGR